MVNNKIYMKDWMALHPYTAQSDTDSYYTEIANAVKNILTTHKLDEGNNNEKGLDLTCCMIAAWFEDIVSETGIWKSFVQENKKRTKKHLPFYEPGTAYKVNEVNREDIQFLLWHALQQMAPNGLVVNPFYSRLLAASEELQAFLAGKLEEAPVNEVMQELLEKACNELPTYYKVLEWFHFNSYINFMKNGRSMMDRVEQLKRENQQMPAKQLNQLVERLRQDLSLEGTAGWWGMTTPAWLELVLAAAQGKGKNPGVSFVPMANYQIESADEESFYLRKLTDEEKTEEPIRIDRFKTPERLNINEQKFVIRTAMMQFRGQWQLLGQFLMQPDSVAEQWKEHEKAADAQEKELQKFCRKMLKKMKEAEEDGCPVAFFRTREEATQYLVDKLGCEPEKMNPLPQHVTKNFAMSVTVKDGLVFIVNHIDALKSDKNPFYNPEEGKKSALWFASVPNTCPREVLSMFIKNGLLDDACLYDKADEERGRTTVQNNWDFWVSYYTNR